MSVPDQDRLDDRDETFDLHERAPFLSSSSDHRSSPDDDDAYKHRQDASPSGPSRKPRVRLLVTLFAMVIAVETGFAMSNGPATRIFESIACRQYYLGYDPTKIGEDGQVAEELCKVKEVQTELAAVTGYMEFFDGLLSMCILLFSLLQRGKGIVWLYESAHTRRFMTRCFPRYSLRSSGRSLRAKTDHSPQYPRVRLKFCGLACGAVVFRRLAVADRVAVVSILAVWWRARRRFCHYLDHDG